MADDDIEGTNALAGFRNPAQAPASPSLDAIDAAAARYGFHPAVLKGIASIESSMDPESNRNRGTQYKGLFQIGKDEWRQYGRGDIYNPADNADAAARMLADHAQWYRDRQGREPTPGDLYMMHLQGRGFIQNGTMTNVAGNPYPGMRGPQTPESFAQGWTGELGRRMARYGGADSIYGNQTAAPSLPAPVNVALPSGGVAAPPQTPLAPPIGGVQAALASLGSPSAGGGTLAGIGKSLMAQAGKTQGLPFPDAKLKPFDENLRPLPLNLPNFAAMAQIPKFAEGGIVDRPTVAMVGEDGPEAIVPLSRSAGGSFPYLGMLEQAGRFMPPVDLPDQPSVNIQRRLDRSRVPMHIGRSIPGFAEGGIVDRPTMAMVGENGPEAIAPLDPFERAAARTRAPYAGANARTSGLPEFIDYLRNRVASTATAPLRALTGQMQVTDPMTGMPTPEAMREGQSVANVATTGAIPFAQHGAAGVFGGKLGSGSIFEALGAKPPALAIASDKILGVVEKLQPGKGNYVSIEKLKAELPSITDKHIIELADQGKLELAPYGGSGAGQHFVTDSQGNRYIGVALVGRPKSEERIGFTSAGAQRGLGKVPAERTQPAMETPEAMAKRKAEMKAAFDELMKKGKPEKTKAAPSAPGRIGFKSLGTER